MIVIDTDISLLVKKLNITQAQLQQYGTMSVEEIVEAEAEKGNTKAVEYATELFTTPEKLVKIFKLSDPNNKLEILGEMTAQQLYLFLPEMEEADISQGLKFFTQDKLLAMLEKIPPEQIVNTVFEMFSKEEVIEYLPEEQLNKFLTSTDIEKNKVLEHMKSIPPEYIAQMIENITGEEVKEMDQEKMLAQVRDFNPLEFKNALVSLQPIAKQQKGRKARRQKA